MRNFTKKNIDLHASYVLDYLNRDAVFQELLIKKEKPLLVQSSSYNQLNFKPLVPMTSTPYEAEIHLTNDCNLSCLHCAYNAGKRIKNELTIAEWKHILNQLEELQTFRIIISGGEPLLFQAIENLLEFLSLKRFRIDFLTNGTLIDAKIAKYLSSPNFSTTISLDGPDDKTHDMLRGEKCFNQVLNGASLLSQNGACFNFATTIHKLNMHVLDDIVKVAIKLKAKSVGFIILDPIGRAKYQTKLILASQDIVEITENAKKLVEEYGSKIFIDFLDPADSSYRDVDSTKVNSMIFCSAGTSRLAIRSDGAVFPCVYAFHDNKFLIDSAKTQTILDIWLSENWNSFRGAVNLNHLHECKACSFLESCSLKICRLRPYYSNGDFFGKPQNCKKSVLDKQK